MNPQQQSAIRKDMTRKKVYHFEPPDEPETLEWWSMTPAQRFVESGKLRATFLALGGSLDPEPDWQSPFYFPEASDKGAADGGPGLHFLRRGRVQPRRRSRRSRR
jgi:hypothetical protein